MKVLLVLLICGAIAVNCNPVDKKKYDEITKRLAALTKRVEDLKKEVKDVKPAAEKPTTNSLEDSLEAAVKADSKKEDEASTKKDIPVKTEVLGKHADAPVKTEIKKEATNKDAPVKANDVVKQSDTPVKKEKDNDDVKADQGEAMWEIVEGDMVVPKGLGIVKDVYEEHQEDLTKSKRTEEIKFLKDSLKKIKNTVKDMKKEFDGVKSTYAAMKKKDEPLDDESMEKFDTIKDDMEDVVEGVHKLSDQLEDVPAEKKDEALSDMANEDTFSMLSIMDEQLKGAADAIKELKKMGENRKREMEVSKDAKTSDGKTIASVGEPVAEVVTQNKDTIKSKDAPGKKENTIVAVGTPISEVVTDEVVTETGSNDKDDMEALLALRDDVKKVISKMKDIKASIDERRKHNA